MPRATPIPVIVQGLFSRRSTRWSTPNFFDHLFAEVEAATEAEQMALRAAWLAGIKDRARMVLTDAETGSPTSSLRRLRARVRAKAALDGGFRRAFRRHLFPSGENS